MTEGDEAAGRRGMLTALRDNPEWRKLFLARAISLLGNWLNTLALVHLLASGGRDDAHTALALAFVFVLKQVPLTLLGPLAGVVADRFDRRRIMILCELAAAAVVLGLLAATPGHSHAWVYLVTVVEIALSAFFLPAFQAVTPNLVAPRDIVAANVLSAASWSVMFTLGTALGGIVLEVWGWRAAVVLDALSYLASGLLVASIRWRSPPRSPRSGPLVSARLGLWEVREGLRYLRDHPDVRRVLLVKFGWGSMGAITVFLTLLGLTPAYRLGDHAESGVSWLWSWRALGTLFGPFLARAWAGDEPARLRRTIAISFFAAPAFYVALALAGDLWLGALLVFCAHLAGSTLWVISTVLLQQTVPDALRGRTFATELALNMLAGSLSLLVYAALIDFGLLSLEATIVLASSICLVPATVWWRRERLLQPSAPGPAGGSS